MMIIIKLINFLKKKKNKTQNQKKKKLGAYLIMLLFLDIDMLVTEMDSFNFQHSEFYKKSNIKLPTSCATMCYGKLKFQEFTLWKCLILKQWRK